MKRTHEETSSADVEIFLGDSDDEVHVPSPSSSAPLSKKQLKNQQKKMKKKQARTKSKSNSTTPPPPPLPPSTQSALQASFASRLTGSRFRSLNEDLYMAPSSTSFTRFTAAPALFDDYHVGFREQVKVWPVNPLDVIINWLRKKYEKGGSNRDDKQRSEVGDKKRRKKSNNNNNNNNNNANPTATVIADFGCGDARLSSTLSPSPSFFIHSFDLVSRSPLVTACDMSATPLPPNSVDVAVFCLALMGTNIIDFVKEARRVVKDGGIVKIAEVRSRFETADVAEKEVVVEKDKDKDKDKKEKKRKKKKKKENFPPPDPPPTATLLDTFVLLMKSHGFQKLSIDSSNKMFLLLEFRKMTGFTVDTVEANKKFGNFSANACIYKRR